MGSLQECSSDIWLDAAIRQFRLPIVPYKELPQIRGAEILDGLRSKGWTTSENFTADVFWKPVMVVVDDPQFFDTFDSILPMWHKLAIGSLLVLRVVVASQQSMLMQVVSASALRIATRFLVLTQNRAARGNLDPSSTAEMSVGDVLCSHCSCIFQKEPEAGTPQRIWIERQGRAYMHFPYYRWRVGLETRGRFHVIGTDTDIVTDKIWRHNYHLMYDRTLPVFTDHDAEIEQSEGSACLFEIGYGCTMEYGAGSSGYLWSRLFKGRVKVHFLEYDAPCVKAMPWHSMQDHNYTVHIGDQADVLMLERLKRDVFAAQCADGLLDIVVDDGSHESRDIITSFLSLWPVVRKNGGQYYIEDLGSSSYNSQLYHIPEPQKKFGDERPGTSLFFVTSLLGNLFRTVVHSGKNETLRLGIQSQRIPSLDLNIIQCRRNICMLQK